MISIMDSWIMIFPSDTSLYMGYIIKQWVVQLFQWYMYRVDDIWSPLKGLWWKRSPACYQLVVWYAEKRHCQEWHARRKKMAVGVKSCKRGNSPSETEEWVIDRMRAFMTQWVWGEALSIIIRVYSHSAQFISRVVGQPHQFSFKFCS